MQAVLCPVCNGRGKLPPQENFTGYYEIPCHGCGGKGWVSVLTIFISMSEDEPFIIDPDPRVPLDDNLKSFYIKKGYDVCHTCGHGRDEPALTGCSKGSHYGAYCIA